MLDTVQKYGQESEEKKFSRHVFLYARDVSLHTAVLGSIGSHPNSYFEYQQLDINSFLCRRSTIVQMVEFLLPHL